MGIFGGILGGIFNKCNEKITSYRMKHINPKRKLIKVLEGLIDAVLEGSGQTRI